MEYAILTALAALAAFLWHRGRHAETRAAEAETRAAAADERAKRVPALEQQVQELGAGKGEAEREAAQLKTQLEAERKSHAEKEKALREMGKEVENNFVALAGKALSQNSDAFLKLAGKNLEEKKGLIDQNLSAMNEKLKTLHQQSSELKSSIDTSRKTTETLNEHTVRLREILSSSQQRGQWGERMVEDILGFVGLLEKVHYTKQETVASGQRPDFTFILPQEKRLNMDVKFPLAHYENYLAAEDEGVRAAEKASFLKNVRNHIKSVCGREYINTAEGTLEYVMMFIPNESIYGFINREDPQLIDYALGQKVLLCSPLTLYAMLSLIHQATRNFTMNERASEVMALVQQFRVQWGKYVEQMDKLGRRIEGLSGDYQTLVTTRTRALERPLDKIEGVSLPTAGEENPPAALPAGGE